MVHGYGYYYLAYQQVTLTKFNSANVRIVELPNTANFYGDLNKMVKYFLIPASPSQKIKNNH